MRRIVRQADRPAVRFHDDLAEIEPQTETASIVGNTVLPAVEFLKDLCLLRVRNAWPVIRDADLGKFTGFFG